MATYDKPLPVITPMNRPHWEAAKNHELRMQRCNACGQLLWPISVLCQGCWSEDFDWVRLSGKGKLSSWAVHHQAFHPAFLNDIPYAIAEVELEEGPRLQTNIVGMEARDFREGMPVEVHFDDVTPEVTLVKFRPAGASPQPSPTSGTRGEGVGKIT